MNNRDFVNLADKEALPKDRGKEREQPGLSARALTVVMACTHHFQSPLQIAAQHLARLFVKHGWRVVYVSSPVTPLHPLAGWNKDLGERYRIAARLKGKQHLGNTLTEIVPFAVIAPKGMPILRSRFVTLHWHRSALPTLYRRLKIAEATSADLLYIDNIFLWPVLDVVKSRHSVFRIMDPHDDFRGWQGHTGHLARLVATRTQGTLYSHPGLESYALSLGAPKVQCHPNGVDMEIFQGKHPKHPMFARWPGRVAVYVGAVDYRLDFALIAEVARLLPKWHFVLAGPISARPGEALPPNVSFPGAIQRSELPSFLSSATVGFLPYNVREQESRLTNVRPLKMLECLAVGLPVVCAHWDAVQKMNSPALLYHDAMSCASALERSAENPPDPETCRRFAAQRDWAVAYQELLTFAGVELPE